MTIKETIKKYISSQPKPKNSELNEIHQLILQVDPSAKLWFLDGKDEKGKIVSNPNIGYGTQLMKYAGGKTREFYQVGLSANTTGISVYIMGLADKNYLKNTFSKTLGKASITGYCIKFRSLEDIDTRVLENAIRIGLKPEQG